MRNKMNREITQKLCEVAEITMGQSPESESYNDKGDGIPFYQGKSDFGEVYPTVRMYCTSPKKIAMADDILMSVRAPIGDVNIAQEKCCIGRGLAAIRPKGNTNLKYLFYLLDYYKERLAEQGTGSTFKAISKDILNELHIPMWPLEKQKWIADVIDEIQTIIFNRKETLSILDELVKSRFIEMFGDININNKNWPIKPLGELCDIYRGGSPRPINKFLGGDVPWIKIGDATKGDEIYLHSTKEHIIKDGVKKSRMVKSGSLIFANCGVSLGFARIITFDGCIHDGWLAFEDVDESLDKVFLLLSLNQMTEYFRAIAPDGTQPNLNTTIMKMHQQIIPPIKLQRQFVEFVRQADKSKLAVQQSIETLQTLKAKLMQDYFG